MSEEILINVSPRETRVAIVENGVLQEILIERTNRRGLVGNVYMGKVVRLLPGMQAAFVDMGLERAAFLHLSDMVFKNEEYSQSNGYDRISPQQLRGRVGAERVGREGINEILLEGDGRESNSPRNSSIKPIPESITDFLREGQCIPVQVIKDPIGTKGARLTTRISLPSRYLVFMPDLQNVGVSQRIEDLAEKQRLKKIVENFASTQQKNGGYIVRTAAEGASEKDIIANQEYLSKLWKSISIKMQHAKNGEIIHEDLPLSLRALRDHVSPQTQRVLIDHQSTNERALTFVTDFVPTLIGKVEFYNSDRPLFDLYGIEDEIQKALQRKVQLKSGGHLFFDQTEALTTIDVNTGAFVGYRNLEETIFKTNLEAAIAIARQLRLRNLGGIIIIDFIDMVDDDHKRQVLHALEKALNRDHTKNSISEVSSLGLVEMTRKRTRESLEHILCEVCSVCNGRGTIKTPETLCNEIFREILRAAKTYDCKGFLILAAEDVINKIREEEFNSVALFEMEFGKTIKLQVETLYTQEQFDVVLV